MHTEVLVVLLAAIFAISCQSEVGRCVDHLQELGAIKLDLEEPVYWDGVKWTCCDQEMDILYYYEKLNEEERALCGDQLVPYNDLDRDQCWKGKSDELEYFDFDMPTLRVVNLTSGNIENVGINFMFSCGFCQRKPVVFPRKNKFIHFDDQTTSERFQIQLTQTDNNVKVKITEEAKSKLETDLCELLKQSDCSVSYINESLDEDQHFNIKFRVFSPISRSIPIGRDTNTSVFNDTYLMRVEDADFCPEGETIDVDGAVSLWPRLDSPIGRGIYFQFFTNASTGAITRRDCRFNDEIFRGDWRPRISRWGLVWKESCTLDEQFINEEYYIQFLNSSDIKRRHEEVLDVFTKTSGDTNTFQEVARIVEREVQIHNELSERIIRDLVIITAKLVLESDFIVSSEPRVSLIVADLKGSKSVEGFTLDFDASTKGESDKITVNRKPTVQGLAPFALDVSGRLLEAHKRVAFVVVWKNVFWHSFNTKKSIAVQYLEVTVTFPHKGEVSAWSFASYSKHHIDITYDEPMIAFSEDYVQDDYHSYNYISCSAWNNNLRDWSSQGCAKLYSDMGNFSACRCSGKYFAMQDGVPIARFALKKIYAADEQPIINNPWTDLLKDKPGLMTATAIECLLSVLGLGSIFGTAIFFKQWRENTGHKILLHMVLALTCNLVLGFTVSFVRMTTESIGCLVYGVLRHYSFLAMFLWMLVLSCLQLKRLTTVAGAKATTHLILKVATFAWGVPLVPIIILLSCNPGFYQTDRFDRGYCYPEGIVFQVTVQAPAGFILFVNFCIFIKILKHIFKKDGEGEITRHSKNQKAEQMNKLKTSFFIFFLFGFTWVFHIFSEERVIVSDFLFEYLFLMTATTHIFTLSLFFVVLQESTRKNWAELIGKAVSKLTRRS